MILVKNIKLKFLFRALVSGWANVERLVRPDFLPNFLQMFQDGWLVGLTHFPPLA